MNPKKYKKTQYFFCIHITIQESRNKIILFSFCFIWLCKKKLIKFAEFATYHLIQTQTNFGFNAFLSKAWHLYEYCSLSLSLSIIALCIYIILYFVQISLIHGCILGSFQRIIDLKINLYLSYKDSKLWKNN